MAGKQRVELVKKNIERNGDEKLRKKKQLWISERKFKMEEDSGNKKIIDCFCIFALF